jgi:hypothetical protein
MAISMMQGDKYAIPFVLQTLDGTLITPDMVNTVILNLGSFSRQYPGDVAYENGKWLMPLAQRQTFAMRGFVEPQARVEFSDGTIFGGAGESIDVTQALSLGIIGSNDKNDSFINKNSAKNTGVSGMIFIRINVAGVEVTINGAVRYDVPQDLTEEQKEQARNNIEAISTESISQVLGTSESKIPSEKAVSDAIANAGGGDMLKSAYDPNGEVEKAGGIADYVEANSPVKSVDGETGTVQTHAVKTTEQALSDEEQHQARSNIGAGTSNFSGSYNDLTDQPMIPKPYTLPVASEDALGGVKAIPKTDEMTAQVGVDESGALWYKPGTGGTSETPTADEVLFTKDLVLTEQFGRYVPVDGKVTVPAENISVQAVVLDAFSQDKNPTITQPSVSVSSSTARAYEVGTSVTPAYNGSLNPGAYEYKPKPTGVAAQSWSAVNNVTSEQIAAQSGTFAAYIVPDGANYKITLNCTYSDGEIPFTALDQEYPDGQIKGGTKSATTGAITGYRNSFYGTTTDKKITTDSTLIRGLAQKSNRSYSNGSTFSVTIPVGAIRVIIAYPAVLRDLTSIKDVNGMNTDITSAFVKSTIDVEGASSYLAIPYKVYTQDFAAPNDVKDTYTVTI